MWCPAKIKKVEIEKQPFVQGGMIRCNDPNCKMMHEVPTGAATPAMKYLISILIIWIGDMSD